MPNEKSMSNVGRKGYATRIINRFKNAVVEMAYLGAKHPDEHEEIEKEYKRSREILMKELMANAIANTALRRKA